MAANTVEATLASRYVDGVSRGMAQTQAATQAALNAMVSTGSSAAAGFQSAVGSMNSSLMSLRDTFTRFSNESQSGWRRWSFAALASVAAVVAGVASVAGAVGSYLAGIGREASEVTELKVTFEGLAQAVGWNADTLSRLRHETENLVPTLELSRNANRVMQSGVQVSSEMYTELVGNIFRMAKASGVEGTQAVNLLTDALIKGNARGFQTVGLTLNVRDALTEAAAAAGQNARSMESAAKMKAFYNEMLEQTRLAVSKLPGDFMSLDDAITRGEKAWRAYFVAIGEGMNRSAVLQEFMKQSIDRIEKLASTKGEIEAIALATNRAVIAMLRGGATAIELFGWVASAVGLIQSAVQAVVGIVGAGLALVFTGVRAFITAILQLSSFLPGAVGRYFREWANDSAFLLDLWTGYANDFANSAIHAFDGLGGTQAKMDAFAGGMRSMAADLEKYANETVKVDAANAATGNGFRAAAQDVEKLKKQIQEYESLRREMARRLATPDQAALGAYLDTLAKIEKLDMISEQKKNDLRRAALKQWAAEMVRIQQEANNKAFDDWKALHDLQVLIQSQSDPLKIAPPPNLGPKQPGNLGDDAARNAHINAELERMKEWQRIQDALRANNQRNGSPLASQAAELRQQLEQLNLLNMNPFTNMLQTLKNGVFDFAGQAGMAIANFFADWVSGQEGAGKKLLAAFLGMIGQMLVKTGVMMIQLGIAEMALASTMIGRWMGFSHAAGARLLAQGIIISAAGGIMMGASAALASSGQTSTSGSTSFQQGVARPIAGNQVQVVQVGQSGRSQNPGEATQKPRELGTLRIQIDRGVIVKEVESNIRSNGVLRTVVQSV